MNWLYMMGKLICEQLDSKNNPDKYENGTTLDNVLAFIAAIVFIGLGIWLLNTNILGIIVGIGLILLSIVCLIGIMGIKGFLGTVLGIALFIGFVVLITSEIGQKILAWSLMFIIIVPMLLFTVGNILENVESTIGRIILMGITLIIPIIIIFSTILK